MLLLTTPFATFTTVPATCFDELSRIVNVTAPSLTVPAGLLTVADREIDSPALAL